MQVYQKNKKILHSACLKPHYVYVTKPDQLILVLPWEISLLRGAHKRTLWAEYRDRCQGSRHILV